VLLLIATSGFFDVVAVWDVRLIFTLRPSWRCLRGTWWMSHVPPVGEPSTTAGACLSRPPAGCQTIHNALLGFDFEGYNPSSILRGGRSWRRFLMCRETGAAQPEGPCQRPILSD
jgi:hypothetical protein